MDKEKIKKIVDEKFDAAFNASDHPKKFYVTENGRGVVDGGDLYNAVLKDVLGVVQTALVDIIEETLSAKPQPAPQNEKVSTNKNPAQGKDKRK